MVKRFFIILLLVSFMPLYAVSAEGQAAKDEAMRGVWVPTVSSLNYPSIRTANAQILMRDADRILDNCLSYGLNTVFFQVRPASDAFYKSDIFPYSKWLTGIQGMAPWEGFDPLEYWVEGAHKRGIKLHAWINPYRVTADKSSLGSLAASNPAKLHPEYVFLYTNGNYYYNPAVPEVRQLVIDGIKEIVDNYDVDGIHLDDYFYPGSDVVDYDDYLKYNTGFANIEDWRRNNCDLLVKGISDLLSNYDVEFGISPCGIWANKSTNILGSDTDGFQSYADIYADSRKWAVEGWIDYIVPQIYWQIGYPAADYKTLAQWWSDTLKDSPTKLYIGLADYKCENTAPNSVWYNGMAIRQELELNKQYDKIGGEVHFNYGVISRSPMLQKLISEQAENNTAYPTAAASITAKGGITILSAGKIIYSNPTPVKENGIIFVPARTIFENLGMRLYCTDGSSHITAINGGKWLFVSAESDIMMLNGKEVQLDTAPVTAGTDLMIPLTVIASAYNCTAEADGDSIILYLIP